MIDGVKHAFMSHVGNRNSEIVHFNFKKKSRSIPGDLINKIRFPGVFQEIKKITVFFKEFQGPGNDFDIFPGFQGIPGGVRTLINVLTK